MKPSDESINNLIIGGILGTALGTIISKNKSEGAILGAILGAATAATIEANKIANQTNITQVIEVDGTLVQINPDGSKQVVKNIRKFKRNSSQQIKLV